MIGDTILIPKERLARLRPIAVLWASAIAMAVVPPGAATAQEVERSSSPDSESGDAAGFEAELKRTWSGDGVTTIDGLAQVPLSMLAGGTTDAYRFELVILDSAGTQLYRDSWERHLSQRAADYAMDESSTLLEAFRFGVTPGQYAVDLWAYPTDAPDLGERLSVSIEGYAAAPMASDLFLANRVEPLDESGGGNWSITRGGFGISTVVDIAVMPTEPRLFYYIELYDDSGEALSGDSEIRARILGREGREIFATPPTSVAVPAGGVPYAGSLSLAGLPPGAYELELRIGTVGGGTVTRVAPFRMLDTQTGPAIARGGTYEAEYFASLSDEELAATFGGVGYLVGDDERSVYESLPPDAKRRYLAEFFASRDTSPDDPSNPFLEEYVDRVGTARMRYGDLIGTRERLPWTTDAGRIILRHGQPDERVINHFPQSADHRSTGGIGSIQGEAPYEIWNYHATGYVYLFIEESQMGSWRMIFTTDPRMRSLADWSERVGNEALRDLTTKFGIQPRF